MKIFVPHITKTTAIIHKQISKILIITPLNFVYKKF